MESVPPVPEVVHSMPNIDDALDLPSTSDVLLDSTPPVILICLDSPLTLISAPTDNVIMSTRPDGADDIATIAPVEPSISQEPDVVMDIQPTTYNEAETNVSEGNEVIIDSNSLDTSSIAPTQVIPPIEQVTDSSEVSTSLILIGLCKFFYRCG